MKKMMMVMVIVMVMATITTATKAMAETKTEVETEDTVPVYGRKIRILSEDELEFAKKFGFIIEPSGKKILHFLNETELEAGYIYVDSKEEQLVQEIFDNPEVVKNPGYYVVPQKIMDDLREYSKNTLSDATEDTSKTGKNWTLTDDYSLFLSFEDRNFYLVDKESNMSVRIQNSTVGSESNADTDNTYNNPCICWGEQTLIFSGGKLTIWKLGEKLTEIELPGNGWILKADDYDKKVYFRVNKTVYVWDSHEEDYIEVICDDYSPSVDEFEVYGETFFYINEEGYISMINLTDGCKITLQKQAIDIKIDHAEYEHIFAIGVDGEKFSIPGYFNQDGKFETFKYLEQQ